MVEFSEKETWVYGVFRAFRERVIVLTEEFNPHLSKELDRTEVEIELWPPSWIDIFMSTSVESTNIMHDLFTGSDDSGPQIDTPRETPEDSSNEDES